MEQTPPDKLRNFRIRRIAENPAMPRYFGTICNRIEWARIKSEIELLIQIVINR
jgi:hypothetical protein